MTVSLFACDAVVSCEPCPDCSLITGVLYLPKSCATNSEIIFSVPGVAGATAAVLGYTSGGDDYFVSMSLMTDAYGAGVNATVCRRMDPAAAPAIFDQDGAFVRGALPADVEVISVAYFDTAGGSTIAVHHVGGDCLPVEEAHLHRTLIVNLELSTFRIVTSSATPCAATWGIVSGLGYLSGLLPDLSGSSTANSNSVVIQNYTGLEGEGCDESGGTTTTSPVTFSDNGYNQFGVPHDDGKCMAFSDSLSFELSNSFGGISVTLTVSKTAGADYAIVTGSASATSNASASQACDDNIGDTPPHTVSESPADEFTIPYPGGTRVCLYLNLASVTHSFDRTAKSEPPQSCGCQTASQWGWRTESNANVTPYIAGLA